MSREVINIGFLGFGTVGSGAVKILQEHNTEISKRLSPKLKIKTIASPNIANRDTRWVKDNVSFTTDVTQVINDPDIDIVVEVMGGREPANSYIRQAMAQGKSVVTANKLLLASDGPALAELAQSQKVSLAIEASVAGGIPILNAIREGIAAEKVVSICGILNGTTNFILTEMENSGALFSTTLAEAQKLGYAEADPTLDIEGLDARDKLAILTMLCFGRYVDVKKIPTQGITKLTPADFAYAAQSRCTIKLICSARLVNQELILSVAPTLVPRNSLLAKVNGSFNAIMLTGEAGGQTFYYGRGAGSGPTGVAIVSDIIRIAREIAVNSPGICPTFDYQTLVHQEEIAISSKALAYFLRFTVADKPGIIAKLATILSDNNISLDSIYQEKVYKQRDYLSFITMLEPTTQQQLAKALETIQTLDFLIEPPLVLPIDDSL